MAAVNVYPSNLDDVYTYINSTEFISKSNKLIENCYLKLKTYNYLEKTQLLSELKNQYKIFRKLEKEPSSDIAYTILLNHTGACLKNEIKRLKAIKKVGHKLLNMNEMDPDGLKPLPSLIDAKNVKYIRSELAVFLMNNSFGQINEFLKGLRRTADPFQYKREMPRLNVADVAKFHVDKDNNPIMYKKRGWIKYLLYHFGVTAHDEAFGRKIQKALFTFSHQTHYQIFANALQVVSLILENSKIREMALQELGKAIASAISLSTDSDETERTFNIILKTIQVYMFLSANIPADLITKIVMWLELQSDDKVMRLKTLSYLPQELRIVLHQVASQRKYPEMSEHHEVWKDRLEKILQSDLKGLNLFQEEIGKRNLQALLVEHFSGKTKFSKINEVDFVGLMQQVSLIRSSLGTSSSSSISGVSSVPNYLQLGYVLGMGSQKVIELVINVDDFTFGAQAFAKGASSISSEIKFMKLFDGPGFIRLMHVFEKKTNSDDSITYLMELCDSDLNSLFPRLNDIHDSKTLEDHVKLFDIIEQCLKGLVKLDKKQIFHRDIKEHNILIKEDKAMIADFGLAIEKTQLTSNPKCVGTYAYRDPAFTLLCQLSQRVLSLNSEITKKTEESGKKIFRILKPNLKKCTAKMKEEEEQINKLIPSILSEAKPDLWSFGVALYRILYFQEKPIENMPFLSQEQIRSLFPKDMDEAGMSVEAFTYRLLQVNPKKRPAPREALKQWREIRSKNPLFFENHANNDLNTSV